MTREPCGPFSCRELPWNGVELSTPGHGGWTRAAHGGVVDRRALALLFLVATAGHVVLNGRVLPWYLRALSACFLPFSCQAIAALGEG